MTFFRRRLLPWLPLALTLAFTALLLVFAAQNGAFE